MIETNIRNSVIQTQCSIIIIFRITLRIFLRLWNILHRHGSRIQKNNYHTAPAKIIIFSRVTGLSCLKNFFFILNTIRFGLLYIYFLTFTFLFVQRCGSRGFANKIPLLCTDVITSSSKQREPARAGVLHKQVYTNVHTREN